jgi:DNA-binding IclR family transcriptional regulator
MACINPDGTLTTSAKAVLQVLAESATPTEVARKVGLPLFRVRSSLRELVEAALLVEETDGSYRLTAAGTERLKQ